mgnify:CR=1 FL=1
MLRLERIGKIYPTGEVLRDVTWEVKSGDRIVAHRTIYGCTWSLLANWMPRFGVETTFTDLLDVEALERHLALDPVVAAPRAMPGDPLVHFRVERLEIGRAHV